MPVTTTHSVSGESLIDSLKAKVSSLWVGDSAATPSLAYHPLNPLSKDELARAVSLVTPHAAGVHPGAHLRFKHLTLLEPPKAQLVPYLLSVRAGEHPDPLPRLVSGLIAQALPDETVYTEYVVSLTEDKVVSTKNPQLGDHAPLDEDEMAEAEQWLLNDPDFIEVVKKLRLPPGAQVVADSWPYGADTFDETPRLIPFMLYFRLSQSADSNHYAYPLPLLPAIDPHTRKLHSLNFTPIYGGESVETIESLWARGETFPWEKLVASEYHHELQTDTLRSDVKNLEIVQRDGPGFKVDGYHVEWQKWDFRVGFNYREGMVLYDVKYDGRDIFHRLSLSDMTVPYGDPRAPFHRKQAFDLGDVGAGLCANQLDLGCDCLGLIHYFSGDLITSKGDVKHMKNVICMHEQDEGIGWKHTNFRTGNASVTRSRVLILQTVLTVANYEYILIWKFDQAANLHFETRATGILSTHAILPGETSPYGTVVSPGVLAPNHQHLFSLRIDPAIGQLGQGNTVIQEDSIPMAFDPKNPPSNNQYGVGYTVHKTPIAQSGHADANPQTNRIFKIVNPSQTNPISGRNIAYKLVPMPSQLMLAHPESVGAARAEFADHHIWVTAHRDNELFSGGEYTNQSNGGARGIRSWVARNDPVENSDLVLWHTFGLTHNTRVEDFPVMPVEVHMLSFKPMDFFHKSPAIDVPASTQRLNRSVLASNWQGSKEVEDNARVNGGSGSGVQGLNGTAGSNGTNGHGNGSCCA